MKISKLIFHKSYFLILFLLILKNSPSYSQSDEKKWNFYVKPIFGENMKLTSNNINNFNLVKEINLLNPKIEGIGFGLKNDIFKKKTLFISVGGEFLFLANKLKTIKLPSTNNNNYSYRFEYNSFSIPIEVKKYLNTNSKINVFALFGIKPDILITGKLSRKEQIYDQNQVFQSTNNSEIDNIEFNKLNATLNSGIGFEIKTRTKFRILVLPTYSYQILPIWKDKLKYNLKYFGANIGVSF